MRRLSPHENLGQKKKNTIDCNWVFRHWNNFFFFSIYVVLFRVLLWEDIYESDDMSQTSMHVICCTPLHVTPESHSPHSTRHPLHTSPTLSRISLISTHIISYFTVRSVRGCWRMSYVGLKYSWADTEVHQLCCLHIGDFNTGIFKQTKECIHRRGKIVILYKPSS